MNETRRMVTFGAVAVAAGTSNVSLAQSERARELRPPPNAAEPDSIEVLRVWAQPGKAQQVTLKPVWKDTAAWGLVLADIMRHVAKAHAVGGVSEGQVIARVLEAFVAEIGSPTDAPKQIDPKSK
jgi:uncharacterized protein YqfA (UPF0365 family)